MSAWDPDPPRGVARANAARSKRVLKSSERFMDDMQRVAENPPPAEPELPPPPEPIDPLAALAFDVKTITRDDYDAMMLRLSLERTTGGAVNALIAFGKSRGWDQPIESKAASKMTKAEIAERARAYLATNAPHMLTEQYRTKGEA